MEKHRSAVIYEIGSDVFNPELLFQKLVERKEELEKTFVFYLIYLYIFYKI